MRFTLLVLALALVATACGDTSEPEPQPQASVAPAQSDVVEPDAHAAWSTETSIGTIVADVPDTARVFELVEIDYCCGGDTSLGDAAVAAGSDPERLLAALVAVEPSVGPGRVVNWQKAPLPDLLDHIVATHHTWLRRELPRIGELVETVASVHGDVHPELSQVERAFGEIDAAIGPHLALEEEQLFPAIRALADGKAPVGVDTLLAEMRTDHDAVGAALHTLRDLTNGYEVPEDACPKYRQMLAGLAELETDLHKHVHLENNVLLPRAQAMLAKR